MLIMIKNKLRMKQEKEEKTWTNPKRLKQQPFQTPKLILSSRFRGHLLSNMILSSHFRGHLLSDVSPAIHPEEMVDDVANEKAEDWDDREKIPDPEAVKPEDWDESAPKQIEDPDAVKPEGWLDGEDPTVPDVMADRPPDWDDEVRLE